MITVQVQYGLSFLLRDMMLIFAAFVVCCVCHLCQVQKGINFLLREAGRKAAIPSWFRDVVDQQSEGPEAVQYDETGAPINGTAFRIEWDGALEQMLAEEVATMKSSIQRAALYVWLVSTVVAAGLFALAGYLFSQGRALQKTSISRPLLKRPGLIVDRRSETKIRGWGGRTTYYFKIELEDGVVGEFRYPGLGAREEPYATNLPGVAYTRGEDLLLFRHIRV